MVRESRRPNAFFVPVDIAARRKYYADAGWSEYDPTAPGYTQEQIRKERELYGKRRPGSSGIVGVGDGYIEIAVWIVGVGEIFVKNGQNEFASPRVEMDVWCCHE